MADIEELVVRARPEGLDETVDGFDQMQGELDDTAQTMEDATGQFEDLQDKWSGALQAILAGVTVAVGGLLTTVPILGEVMAGLGAIASALGFQLDQVLRPALQPLTQLFFDVANALFQVDGVLGDVVGVVALLGTAVAGAVSGFVAWVAATQGVASAAVMVGSALTTIGSAIAGFIAGSTAAAGALGVFAGGLGVLLLETTGVLNAVRTLGRTIATGLPAWARDGFTALVGLVTGPLAVIGAAITGFIQGTLRGGLQEGISQAVTNVKQVLQTFVGAWNRTLDRVDSAVGMLVSGALAWGEQLVNNFVDGIKNNVQKIIDTIESFLPDNLGGGFTSEIQNILNINTGGGGGGGGGAAGFRTQRGQAQFIIDGRNVTSETGRYRRDAVSRRGRNG